jgi:hypothetical protein
MKVKLNGKKVFKNIINFLAAFHYDKASNPLKALKLY